MEKLNLWIWSILFTLLAGTASNVYAQNKIKIIDSLLIRLHQTEGFDGNVLIAEKGHIVYQKSFGYAVAETNSALTENTIFSLASVSKMFTGIAAMKLAEQGKLKLNNDLRAYLPNLPYEHITIYNLLTHTSGLEEYFAPSVRNVLGSEPDNSAIEKAYAETNLKIKFPPGI